MEVADEALDHPVPRLVVKRDPGSGVWRQGPREQVATLLCVGKRRALAAVVLEPGTCFSVDVTGTSQAPRFDGTTELV